MRRLRTLLVIGMLAFGAGRILLLPASSGPATLGALGGPVPAAGAGGDGGGAQSPAPPGELHPGLVAALQEAQAAAGAAGLDLVVTSGYRTPERQQQLLDDEVAERGSYEEASRWVFPPDRSMHVRGLAVDVGDGAAADWLQAHGAAWGICRTLDWEWWHFEWRERWEAAGSCPAPALDPSGAPEA